MAMITVEHLQKNFKKTIKQPGLAGSFISLFKPQSEVFEAVKNFSFEVPKGQILGFIGANGAGKSTTIKMLTGILTPTSGKCEINGKIPTQDRKNYVKDIGVVFGQRTQLWWDLPLRETYSVLKEIYQVPEQNFVKRMDFLNEVLDLQDFISQPVRTLSLGQRMRADIAASLLHSPKVLFLDEPTIGLDVAVKDNIRHAITKINAEEETTIILTTHDLSDIERLAHRIVMIDQGEKIYDGSVQELKHSFADTRELKIELESEIQLDFHDFADGIEVETKGLNVSIKFDASKVAVTELLQTVLRQSAIRDMAVKETDIEEIVRKFFRHDAEALEELEKKSLQPDQKESAEEVR